MNDLVKRLRDVVGWQVGDVPVLIHEAADRIEALEAQNREQALQMLSDAGQFCDLHDRILDLDEQLGMVRTERHADAQYIEGLEARIKAADALADAVARDGANFGLDAYLTDALVAYREASK